MGGADSSHDDLETDLLSLRDAGKGTDPCFTNPWRLQSHRESGGSEGGRGGSILKARKTELGG